MMKIKKKICLVGVGNWGKNYLKTLHKLALDFIVVEQNTDLISELEKQFEGISFYQKIDETYDFCDSYIIATPPKTHFAIASNCLDRKKNVLVEKPLTLNVEDSYLLYEKAKKVDKTLAVGHLLLFHPAIKIIKKLIDSKFIGDLQYIYSNRLNTGKVRKDENVLWSLAPHDISILQYFMDSEYPEDIKCIGNKIMSKEMHDISTTFLSYKSKKINSHIFVNWLNPYKDHSMVVIGSDKMITFNGVSNDLYVHNKFLNKENYEIGISGIPIEKIDYDFKSPLTSQIEFFLDNLDNPYIEYIGGKEAIDVMNILHESSKNLNKLKK